MGGRKFSSINLMRCKNPLKLNFKAIVMKPRKTPIIITARAIIKSKFLVISSNGGNKCFAQKFHYHFLVVKEKEREKKK